MALRLLLRMLPLLLTVVPSHSQQKGPAAYEGDELVAWIKQRAANANAGKREIVRVPLVRRSMAWGCDCPDYYIGTSPDSASGEDIWVDPRFGTNVPLPNDAKGSVVVAEGYFTGKRNLEEHDRGGTSDKQNSYQLWEFKLLRTRPYRDSNEADGFLYLVLDGAEAQKDVPPLADGKPWMVVAASLPLFDKTSAAKAEALRASLTAAGFPAESFDGRQAPLLFCCYQVVVAGRYATKPEADAVAKAATAKKFSAYVRKGF